MSNKPPKGFMHSSLWQSFSLSEDKWKRTSEPIGYPRELMCMPDNVDFHRRNMVVFRKVYVSGVVINHTNNSFTLIVILIFFYGVKYTDE